MGPRFLYQLAKFIKDPQDTPQLFRIVDVFFEGMPRGECERLETRYLADPRFREMFEAGSRRFLHTPFDIDALSRLPEGTLGREFAELVRANRFDPEFFKRYGDERVLDYFATRMGKTHDLWHVLTGFAPDVPGEMALMAFYLRQFDSPFPLSLVLGGVVHLLGTGDIPRLKLALNEVAEGYRNGGAAEKIIGVAWEDHWGEPLQDVRRRYGIRAYRRPTGPSEWPRLRASVKLAIGSRALECELRMPSLRVSARGARAGR